MTNDWVEAKANWWWKYAFPSRAEMWLSVLASRFKLAADAPDPWFQRVAADLLEGLTMLHASACVADQEAGTQLRKEAVEKIERALQTVK